MTNSGSVMFSECSKHIHSQVADHESSYLQNITKTMAFNIAKYTCVFRSDRPKQIRSWHLCERYEVHRPGTY